MEGFTGVKILGGQLRRWDGCHWIPPSVNSFKESVIQDVLQAKPNTYSPVKQKSTLELGEQSTKLKASPGTLWLSWSGFGGFSRK